MKGVSKSAILPICSGLALAIAAIFGHKFTDNEVDTAATILSIGITAGINIWGVIKNHKK